MVVAEAVEEFGYLPVGLSHAGRLLDFSIHFDGVVVNLDRSSKDPFVFGQQVQLI